MPGNLSIKNLPDEVLARLRERAVKNHRSVQGEVRAILDEALRGTLYGYPGLGEAPRSISDMFDKPVHVLTVDQLKEVVRRAATGAPPRGLTPTQVLERARRLGLPQVDEAAALVREDRDSH